MRPSEIDFSWENPSEAQAAALEHAIRYAEPALKRINRQHPGEEWSLPITEFHIAEMMCIAESSLWYAQACGWADGKGYPAQGADEAWKGAGKAIREVVTHGYQDGKWWDPEDIWEHPKTRAVSVMLIVEATRMTRKLRGTFSINSAFFEVLPYLVEPRLNVERILKALETKNSAALALGQVLALYDPEFKKKLDALVTKAKQQLQEEYKPTTCIHPECENLVAPKGIEPREGHYKNYRGTGACQPGHNSYLCTKCNKPHSFASKVGQNHYTEHYGGDWTQERREAWKRSQQSSG